MCGGTCAVAGPGIPTITEITKALRIVVNMSFSRRGMANEFERVV
jgi:hypothetical protein